MNKILTLIILSLIFSCDQKDEKQQQSKQEEIKVEDSYTKYETNFGSIVVAQESSTNYLDIKIEHGPLKGTSFKQGLQSKIISFIETDVNADGIDEYYAIGRKGNMIGYTAMEGNIFTEINVWKQPLRFTDAIKNVEKWELENNTLSLWLSNYNDDKLIHIAYVLQQNKNTFRLFSSNLEDLES